MSAVTFANGLGQVLAPVLLALASYPAKWIEQSYMRRQKQRVGPFYGSAQSRT